ncbi:uncharacterized protein LOC123876553 [Maniola jurtina]|uniref:uncharacterized protein LOC123876553 n=1 Tax=Maniola jurtina TaxID=191418 RepID=UPI001E68E274|nr:uncharacterized protein LOC123876553 [Maniola jurtina]
MRNSLSEKFKTDNFVKPLYRKTKIHDRDNVEKGTIPLTFDRTLKLCGDDFNVKTVISKHGVNVINVKRKINKDYKVVLPGACNNEISADSFRKFKQVDLSKLISKQANKNAKIEPHFKNFDNKMSGSSKDNVETVKIEELNKVHSADSKEIVILHKVPDTWLRIYPAPKVSGETLHSVILRCVLCQLGLTTFLILWTVIAVFTIQSFEGPQEEKVSIEFEKEQNQLVIDLATELRQITPLSPKWRNAIERRIEDERQLTMQAVGDGARIKPGEYWSLPGTFLFTVYVMTALGFGAPVPHTLWGRTSALVYAILAVPTHIYLMVNASTCAVVHLEACARHLRDKISGDLGELTKSNFNKRDIPINSHNSEIIKSSKLNARKSIICCLRVFGVGRGIPLATVSYYTLGLVSFGVLRGKSPSKTFMFPLEFTTSGGLDHVEDYVRILYGFYVEGAMCLLACMLATIRRHSSSALACLSQTHRLFQTDVCEDCVKTTRK